MSRRPGQRWFDRTATIERKRSRPSPTGRSYQPPAEVPARVMAKTRYRAAQARGAGSGAGADVLDAYIVDVPATVPAVPVDSLVTLDDGREMHVVVVEDVTKRRSREVAYRRLVCQ